MPTACTDALGPAPVLGFLLVHAALRREVADLIIAAGAGAPVGTRLELFDRVIRAHHHGEDEVLLPLLRSKEPAVTAVADQVEAQHVTLDATLDRVRALDAGGRLGPDDLAPLATLVEDHLVLEEQELLPTWVASLTTSEHERFARQLRRATPWRDVTVMVPWLLDAVPDAMRPAAETELPRPIRFAYRHGLRRRFERRWNTNKELTR
jgi:hypothetical protein